MTAFANCGAVKKLVVSNNKISVIWNSMLRVMPNLEIFEMENNVVDYTDWNFPDNTFDSLSNLKSLSMQLNDDDTYLDSYSFEFMMRKLPQTLEELNVDIPRFNNLGEWSQRLTKFSKLRKLGIYQVLIQLKSAIIHSSI